MNPLALPSALVAAVAHRLRRVEYVSVLWENEILAVGELAAAERCAARAFASRGLVVSPWHGNLAAARAAIATGRVTPLDGSFEVRLGPGLVKRVRLLLAEPPDRQPILFLAIDGFFAGENSPYDTRDQAADVLVFAMALEALLAAVLPSDGPFIWGMDWQAVPALLRLRERQVTVLHLHSPCDAWLAPALAQISFPGAEQLQHATALRAGLLAADLVASVNAGFTHALRDPGWTVYHRVLAPHLQDACGRLETVGNGPAEAMRPEWDELTRVLSPDSHRAGSLFAGRVLARRAALLPKSVRAPISSRMIVLVGGPSTTQNVPEVAVAAAHRVLATGKFRGYFVFDVRSGDAFTDRRRGEIEALRGRFPREVLVVDDDPGLAGLLRDLADVEVFTRVWEPHGRVYRGATVPVAFGEGPGVQIRSGWARGRGAGFQARFHREDEPRSGWWLFPQGKQAADHPAENWQELVVAPPSPHNRVFEAMVADLATALERAARLWSEEPIAFAAIVLAALRHQEGRSWSSPDSYGRMFELVDRVRGRPGRAA